MQKLIPIFLKFIGGVLILVGLVGAYYGPLEIYVFYLFSEGGQFHYPGFGVGTIWFAYLVIQNMGYYIVAAICIPAGYGHLKLRRWALTLVRLFSWFWLGAGILLFINLLFIVPVVLKLNLSWEVLLTRASIIGLFAIIMLILLPTLSLWFYKSKKVQAIFEAQDQNLYWTERYPFSLLALLLLLTMMIVVMHITILFQALFPLFGQFILGRQSVYLISLCILLLGILMYEIVKLKIWAWWGTIGFLSALTISSLISFSRYSFYDIISMMDLPVYEMDFLNQMTVLHDFRLVVLAAGPLVTALGLLIYSKRYFEKADEPNPSVIG